LGLLDRDSRGFMFSLDLLLALIPLTLLLGLVAADMDNILFQAEDTIFRGSTERVAADAMSTLLETSGEPSTWEQTGNPTVPGLAQYDASKGIPVEGTISSQKLAALTLPQLQNMVGNEYNVYMTVSRIQTSGSNGANIKTLGTYNSNAQDIVRVERVARYALLQAVSKSEGEIRGSGIYREYYDPPGKFATSYYYNQTYDYWIVFDNHGYAPENVNLTINTNTITFTDLGTPLKLDPIYLNLNETNPSQFLNNTVKLGAVANPGVWMNFYIVQVPKNTTSSDLTLQNIIPQPSRVEFYIWTV
jgi:hypothetical protein